MKKGLSEAGFLAILLKYLASGFLNQKENCLGSFFIGYPGASECRQGSARRHGLPDGFALFMNW